MYVSLETLAKSTIFVLSCCYDVKEKVFSCCLYVKLHGFKELHACNFSLRGIVFTLLDIDECHNNPCNNSVSCTNSVGGYTCNCIGGFEGKNCEVGKRKKYPKHDFSLFYLVLMSS